MICKTKKLAVRTCYDVIPAFSGTFAFYSKHSSWIVFHGDLSLAHAPYVDTDKIRGGVYWHDVITHCPSKNFVAPGDGSVHTQNIKNTWFRAKRKLRRQCWTSASLLPSYLAEFLRRNRHSKNIMPAPSSTP